MNELDKAYKEFFGKLKKENPKEYQWFKDQDKKQKRMDYMEIPYIEKKIEYIINDKVDRINNTWIETYKAKLTKKQAEVFKMYHIDKIPVEYIADIKDCGINAIYKILQRINKKLA
jgi:DNA-directed RNA polymerase specialized sigma24 family protein